MKILFISIYDPFTPSGPSNHLKFLSEALINIGCQVHILVPGKETKSVLRNGLTLHYVNTGGNRLLFSLLTVATINKLVKEYEIDIVHGQSPSSFGYALLSRDKTPFVVTVHGTSFGEIISNIRVPLSNLTFKAIMDNLVIQPLTAVLTFIEYTAADEVVIVSENTAKEVQRFFHIPNDKTAVIHNGIQSVRLKTIDHEVIPHSILFVGRLTWRKGLKSLIDALPMIIAKYPDTILFIVGEGDQKKSLKKIAKKYKIDGSIIFLGNISNNELFEIYSKIQIYAQPSLYEPLGIAIIEAMSNSKPVVASNVGGIPELITNSKDGLLVEPANSSQLSKAIIHLFSYPEIAKRYGSQAQEKIRNKFTWEIIAEQTLALYQKTIKNK